jgi:hypothetical protein
LIHKVGCHKTLPLRIRFAGAGCLTISAGLSKCHRQILETSWQAAKPMILSLPLLPADVGHPQASPKPDLSDVVVFSGFLAAIRNWFATISRVASSTSSPTLKTLASTLIARAWQQDVEIDIYFQFDPSKKAVMRYHVLLTGILRITTVIRALLVEVMK